MFQLKPIVCLPLMIAFAGTTASVTAAPPPGVAPSVTSSNPPDRAEVMRVRGVRLLENGAIEFTTEWLDYRPGSSRGLAEYVFDAYESDTGRPGGNPSGGIACGLGSEGSRWFYGAGQYNNAHFVGDMRVAAGAEGRLATHIDYGMHTDSLCQYGVVYHAFFTAEIFDNSGTGPAYSGAYPGVLLEVMAGPGGCGFYSTVTVDLTSDDDELGFRMPLDGEGAFIGMFMIRPDPEGPYVLDPLAQPMLWSTAADRAGESGPLQWDDDTTACGSVNAPDGVHNAPCELYTYEGLVTCPTTPVGAMVGFGLVPGPAPCYADCNGDAMLTVSDFGCFRDLYLASDPRADCDTDGALSVADFGCFRSAYLAGCP